MTRYDSAAWAQKARKRKAYRDHVRDQFFKKTNATKHAEPQDQRGAPESQARRVQALLDLTGKGTIPDAAQKEMLLALGAALDSVSLVSVRWGQLQQPRQHCADFP